MPIGSKPALADRICPPLSAFRSRLRLNAATCETRTKGIAKGLWRRMSSWRAEACRFAACVISWPITFASSSGVFVSASRPRER